MPHICCSQEEDDEAEGRKRTTDSRVSLLNIVSHTDSRESPLNIVTHTDRAVCTHWLIVTQSVSENCNNNVPNKKVTYTMKQEQSSAPLVKKYFTYFA